MALDETLAVCVVADNGARRIVEGVNHRTTAGDVIRAVTRSTNPTYTDEGGRAVYSFEHGDDREEATIVKVVERERRGGREEGEEEEEGVGRERGRGERRNKKKLRKKLLLEALGGCRRPLGASERVCEALGRWRDKAKDVRLVVMDAEKYYGECSPARAQRLDFFCHPGKWREARQLLPTTTTTTPQESESESELARLRLRLRLCSLRQRHGRVWWRKRVGGSSARVRWRVLRHVGKLVKSVKLKTNVIEALEKPVTRKWSSALPHAHSHSSSSSPLPPPPPPSVPLDQVERYYELEDDTAEEEGEGEVLEHRTRVLRNKIQRQERNTENMEIDIAGLEAKLSSREHSLLKLEAQSEAELMEVVRESDKLRNELKVRNQLNQIQSSKIKELTNTLSKTQQALNTCEAKLANLKIQVSSL